MLVRLDRHAPVAVVTLDRPEKRNALSVTLRRELAACFRTLASDQPPIRAAPGPAADETRTQ